MNLIDRDHKFLYARANRRFQTRAEKAMWELLRYRRTGIKFRRQYVILDYIADFASPSRRLIVEVDGGVHESAGAQRYDARRDARITKAGFRILRFKNEEVLYQPRLVFSKIKDAVFAQENKRLRGELLLSVTRSPRQLRGA